MSTKLASCCSTHSAVPSTEKDLLELSPCLDVLESEDEFLVEADLPGVAEDGIDLRLEDGVLSLRAKVAPRGGGGEKCLLREYDAGGYRRELEVGDAVDAEKIAAEYRRGVLTIRLPKRAALKPRKITVTA